MSTPTEWLNRKEAAAYLTQRGRRISASRLANMASNENSGRGPPFTRYGWSLVWYRRGDLDAWLEKNRRRVE